MIFSRVATAGVAARRRRGRWKKVEGAERKKRDDKSPGKGRMTEDERRVKNRERRGTFPRAKERGRGRRRRVQHDQGGEKNRSLEK